MVLDAVAQVVDEITYGKQQDPEKVNSIEQMAKDAIKRHEGRRQRLYLDGSGYPTIGWGTKLSEQKFKNESDPEFIKLKNKTGLWSDEKMDKALDKKFQLHKQELLRIYDKNLPKGGFKFEELPEDVQAHMFSTAYNLGATGYTSKFKNHFEAIYMGDFPRAAYELRYKDGLSAMKGLESKNSKWWNDVAGDTALERIEKGDESYLKYNRGVDPFNVFLNAKLPDAEPDTKPDKSKVGKQLQEELQKSIV